MRTLNEYLDYRLKQAQTETSAMIFANTQLSVIASGRKYEKPQNFYEDIYTKIWGIETANKEDKRTANEIIDDTFNKHGITIIRNEEANK